MIDHLSYSSISLYLECPEAWRRKYIAKEPTRKTGALAFGLAAHATIEQMISGQENWQSVWEAEFERAFTGVFLRSDENKQQYYEDGIKLLEDKNIQAVLQEIKPAAVEYKIELRVPGVPVPVVGFIDIILPDGTLCDIKTTTRPWTPEQAATSLQPLFYLAGLNQAGRKINWNFRHIVLVRGQKPQVQILENQHKIDDLFRMYSIVTQAWNGISTELFPLNPDSWRCNPRHCDFYQNCMGKII